MNAMLGAILLFLVIGLAAPHGGPRKTMFIASVATGLVAFYFFNAGAL